MRLALFGVAVTMIWLLAGCDDRGPTCEARADCGGGYCAPVVAEASSEFHHDCIDLQGADHRCDGNEDCPGGHVCDVVVDRCADPQRECVPRCSSSAQCPTGDECNDGRCEAIPCQSGRYACRDGATCAAAASDPLADDPLDAYGPHGCRFAACASRADCGDGWCIDGQCQDLPGVCI